MSEPAIHPLLLKAQLDQELKLYEDYYQLVDQEKSHISKFDADKLQALTDKREALSQKMQKAMSLRLEMVKKLTGSEKTKLTEAIKLHYKGADARDLLAKAGRLKTQISKNQKQGFEFNQIVSFAMNFINGTVSIFNSASQHVTRSYGRKGTLKENYHPQGHRHSGVIKEA